MQELQLKPMDEGIPYVPEPINTIALQGEPYVHDGHDLNASMSALAENVGYLCALQDAVERNAEILKLLQNENFYSEKDRVLKSGGMLTFEEAFCSAVFVAARINKPLKDALVDNGAVFPEGQTHILQSTALLSTLSSKEAFKGLSSDEIAGVVSGVLEMDTILRMPADKPVLCFGGMGGDKGYTFVEDSKLFSLSTLAAFATSLSGLTHKHHSYPNTSKVAGQTTLEEFGARSDFTCAGEMAQIFNRTSLMMTSCHNTRTIHALSHVLRGETINHLIGPLAFTMGRDAPLQPFIGVNEKVHPQTVIEAMLTIDQRGIQKYDRGVVFCGLSDSIDHLSDSEKAKLTNADAYYNDHFVKDLVRLDEVAPPPYATLAGFFRDGEFLGNYVIGAEDFYEADELKGMRASDLLIPNTSADIIAANHAALSGEDDTKARYLAMTVGLANFVRFSLDDPDALDPDTKRVNADMLRAHTAKAYQDLKGGLAQTKMEEYCAQTQTITPSLAYKGMR